MTRYFICADDFHQWIEIEPDEYASWCLWINAEMAEAEKTHTKIATWTCREELQYEFKPAKPEKDHG